ncbi:RNA polymerase II transcription initiation protein [Microthyrium microscopicum]|uniref:RNA polymerase II transcription factor B subunit 2 n=1 Tax=Microthyrium microscopicum TaxID=703497 RepID=A0A6A6U3Y6_9PEZI|nr:RNA polymerase II transcription initiation protein [Microthyrium microscopicum]
MSLSSAVLDYLQAQPGVTFKRLYLQPPTVLAVLRRMLPHLAKNIIMAMLFMPEPFLEEDLLTWIRAEARPQRDEAMTVLEQLHILTLVPEPPTPRAYRLNTAFASSLRQALMGGGSTNSFGVPADKDAPGPKRTVEELDKWARKQWEAILYYMVGSAEREYSREGNISSGTRKLLEMGEFIIMRGGRADITKGGFTFLLQEANAQVWTLLIVYLENSESVSSIHTKSKVIENQSKDIEQLQMDPVEMLSFLFMLGSLELGQDYNTESLTKTQFHMLEDLHDFGIVYHPPDARGRFYPTRLATTLTSSDASLLSNPNSSLSMNSGKGSIILETNHRIYTYTSSPLQIAVLALFANLNSCYPNLVSGKLTKKSIQRAVEKGITADQIIDYLRTHAHPQMLKNQPVLPPTVVDQIRLWQIEGDRMEATPGFLLKQFVNANEYRETAQYAENLGVLVWRNDREHMFFVTRIEQLQQYLAKRKTQAPRR